MKKLICAYGILSALLYAEQGYCKGEMFKALTKYEGYVCRENAQQIADNQAITPDKNLKLKNKQDTLNRYKENMKDFSGIKFKLENNVLSVFNVENGIDTLVTLESVNDSESTELEEKLDFESVNEAEFFKLWKRFEYEGIVGYFFHNALIIEGIERAENVSFLADRIYTTGKHTCDTFCAGALDGFVNLGASISAENGIKIFTHSGQDVGAMNVGNVNKQGENATPDLDDFFATYCSGKDLSLMKAAFANGWRSLGDIHGDNVKFSDLGTSVISGSLHAKNVTVEGEGSEFFIGNPRRGDSFGNAWLDWLYKKNEYNKSEVRIEKLLLDKGATYHIPGGTGDTSTHTDNSNRHANIEDIKDTDGNIIDVKTYRDTNEVELTNLTGKIDPNSPWSSAYALNCEKSPVSPEEMYVTSVVGDNEKGTYTLYYQKNNNELRFFGKESGCRLNQRTEKVLRYFESNPVSLYPEKDEAFSGDDGYHFNEADDIIIEEEEVEEDENGEASSNENNDNLSKIENKQVGPNENSNNCDLNDDDKTVKRLNEWAAKNKNLCVAAASVTTKPEIVNAIKAGTRKKHLIEVELFGTSASIVSLDASYINGKFKFFTTNGKNIREDVQKLLNKVVDYHLSPKGEGVAPDSEPNRVGGIAQNFEDGTAWEKNDE